MSMDRPLPANIDVERQIIGTLLLETSDDILEYGGELKIDWFHHGGHQRIFKTIIELAESGDSVDPFIVGERLGINDLDKFASEFEALPTVVDIPQYGRVLKENFLRRVAILESMKLSEAAYKPDTTSEEILRAAAVAAETIDSTEFGEAKRDTRAMIKESVLEVEAASKGNNPKVAYYVDHIDAAVTHYRRQVHTLGAFPGHGKTALALQCFSEQAKRKLNVAYFCSESASNELFKRMCAYEMGAPIGTLIDGIDKTFHLTGFKRAVETFDASNEHFEIHGLGDIEMTTLAMGVELRRMKRRLGRIDMVYFDYLQDFDISKHADIDRNAPPDQRIAHNIKEIKKLAGDLDFAAVVLCQFNRDTHKEKRPTQRSFMGSAAIDQASHIMSVLFRPEVGEDGQAKHKTEWYSVKTRLIKPFCRHLDFDGERMRFDKAAQELGDGHRYSRDDRPNRLTRKEQKEFESVTQTYLPYKD